MDIKNDHLNDNIKLRELCFEIYASNSVMSIDMFWKKKKKNSGQKYTHVASHLNHIPKKAE